MPTANTSPRPTYRDKEGEPRCPRVHLVTEVMGAYRLEYEVSSDVLSSYPTESPTPTRVWKRRVFRDHVELSDSEIRTWFIDA